MRELDEPAELVSGTPAVDHRPRAALAEGRDDLVDAVERAVELGPRLADGVGEVRVRRAEPQLVGGRGETTHTGVLVREEFRVVRLDRVDPRPMSVDLRPGERDGREARVRREDNRVLSVDLGHRRLEGDVVGDGVG